MKTTSRTHLAVAAAGLFAFAAAGIAHADDAQTKCEHSTSCKGQSACKNSANSCKGQNACKGKGMTMQKSATDCTAAQRPTRRSNPSERNGAASYGAQPRFCGHLAGKPACAIPVLVSASGCAYSITRR